MNRFLKVGSKYFFSSLILILRFLSSVGSLPTLTFKAAQNIAKTIFTYISTSVNWVIKLLLANLKLILLTAIGAGVIYSAFLLNQAIASLPKVDDLKNDFLPAKVLIYEKNGTLLYRSNRDYSQIPIKSSQISPVILSKQENSWVYSRKLADKLIFGPANFENNLKKVLLTFKIKAQLSQDEIKSDYFNNLAFPDHIVGIEAASEHFLGKNAVELSASDSEYLIGLNNGRNISQPTFPLYQRAPDVVSFVLSELKNQHSDIWKSNTEIQVQTSIDLKLQNDLQQSKLFKSDLEKSAILDPKSHLLLALVGTPKTLPADSHSITKITDQYQDILFQEIASKGGEQIAESKK